MTVSSLRALALLGGLVSAALVLPGAVGGGRGQPAKAPPPARPADRIMGADNCIRCHREPTAADKRPGGVTEFIRLDESTIWQEHDLHARAFDVLKGPLGQRMAGLLKYDVTQSKDCLACHAVDLVPEKRPAEKAAGDFYTDFGVGCEACHGFANEWFAAHVRPAWRRVDPAEKEKQGQVDLRDPARRAERCAGCHVGNAAEGKFVTHVMYAAGHPPLPPLEVMTFSRDQPMHAKLPRGVPYFQSLDADAVWRLFHYRKGECSPARQGAVGAAVAFRTAMRTLAHEAAAAQAGGPVLDFALFDCYACHHDLVSPSWRQERGYAAAPGRPLPFTGPTALLRAVAGNDGAGAFDARYAELLKAAAARPFGDPSAVANAARGLADWSDALAKTLNERQYDDQHVKGVLRDLVESARRKPEGKGRGLDYEDAQQLVWALNVLQAECGGLPPAAAGELAKLAGPEPDRPFLLRLRDDDRPQPVAAALPDRLRRIGRYNPELFRHTFDRIAAALRP